MVIVGHRFGIGHAEGRGITTLDFLTSLVFRAILVPVILVVVTIFARWNIRRDDSTDTFFDMFAVGPDLLIASLLAVPAFLTEKAITLKNGPTTLDDKSKLAFEAALSAASWLYLMVFLLAVIGFTVERKVKNLRSKAKKVKATLVGVLLPNLIGAAAVAATFGLAR